MKRRTALMTMLFLAFSLELGLAQDLTPDTLCQDLEVVAESPHARLSNVQPYRGPFDFDGTRLVGCLTNLSDQTVMSAMLHADYVLERGAGGGSQSLIFGELPPSETRAFMGNLQHRERGMDIQGLVLRELELGFASGDQKSSPLVEAAEIPFSQLPQPEHPLAARCQRALPEPAGAHPIQLSELSFYPAPFREGEYYIIGCLTAFDETAIERNEDGTAGVPASLSATLVEESGSVAFASRSGAIVTRDLELNAPAPFASTFTAEERFPAVTLEFYGYEVVNGAFEMVELAPEAYLVHPGREDEAAAAAWPADDDWDTPWSAPAPTEPIAFMPFAPAPFAATLEVSSSGGPIGELRVNLTPENLRAEFWESGAGEPDPEVLIFTRDDSGEGFSLLVINSTFENYEAIALEEEYFGLYDLLLLLTAPDFSAHPCRQLEWTCSQSSSEDFGGRSAEVWLLEEPGEPGHITVWIDEALRFPLYYSDSRDTFAFFTGASLLELELGAQDDDRFEVPEGYMRRD